MGLNTVELAYSFERYFGVEIPAAVSEKLYTVGDVAAWFSQQLGVAGRQSSAVRAAVATQLVSELPAATTEATLLLEVLLDAQALKAIGMRCAIATGWCCRRWPHPRLFPRHHLCGKY